VGNERGVAPYPAWNAVPLAKAKSGISTGADGRPDGDVWLPNECDTRTRVGAWFWSPDPKNRLKTLDELITIYYQSVGRGAQLLLNIGPDPVGLIPDDDVQRMCEFGAEVKRRFGKSLAETSGKGDMVELDLKQPTRIEHVITMEQILEGERVREYVLEGFAGDTWKELSKGTAIGHKRIDRFAPVEVSKVRLRVVKSSAGPLIRKLAAFAPTAEAGKTPQDTPENETPKKVWQWAPGDVGSEWKTVDIDLTKQCEDACPYQIDFRAAAGSKPLEIQSLNLVYEGTLVPGFVQRAPGGDVARYYVTITALGKSFGVRAVVRAADGEKDSQGTVTVVRRPL
jgi:alpha-L-fucosidase